MAWYKKKGTEPGSGPAGEDGGSALEPAADRSGRWSVPPPAPATPPETALRSGPAAEPAPVALPPPAPVAPPAPARAPEPSARPGSLHVSRTGSLPVQPDTKVPLRIRFIDPVQGIKVGKELRFEVLQGEGPDAHRVAIERLDFAFSPLAWGEVRTDDDPFLGVVRVVAVHRPADIYERPHYDVSATLKARGGTSVETVNQFALALSAPVVELKFYIRDEEDGDLELFHPQEQRRPLDPARDIRATPPYGVEVFEEGRRIFLRILDPARRPEVTVTFPNQEEATLAIDVASAGAPPANGSVSAPSDDATA